MCGTACCIPHSASSACGCTHLCADLSGGTWLPLPLSLFFFSPPPYHVEERESRGKEAEQPCRAARRAEQRDDHHQPRSALACHVLLDAAAKHTQYHTSPTSLPPRHPLHLLITAFPFPLSRCDTTTKKVSAPPCSRASAHAMAAMGDGVVGVGRGSNRREEEEEAQHLTHSHMYHLLLVCACVACRWRRT